MAHGALSHSETPVNSTNRWSIEAALMSQEANKPGLEIGQPDVIRPPIGADRDRTAAPEIGAIDQDAADTGLAHFTESDLVAVAFHRAIKARSGGSGNTPWQIGNSRCSNKSGTLFRLDRTLTNL
jgi:hypothetical protein